LNLILNIFFSSLIFFLNFTIAQQNELNEGTLHHYDFSGDKSKTITLPKELNEISGLTITDDGRLFAHNDEIGEVYELDIETGNILNQFKLGNNKLKKDFEGIAVVKDSLFMVTSSGVIYKFSYLDEEENVNYKIFKTFLSAKYNIEGLCYDEATNSLLLACKEYAGKKLKRYKAVYSFNLTNYSLNEIPLFLIDLQSLKNKFNINNFSPTGIEINSNSGNIFVLSSNEKAIVELSAQGKLLNVVKLESKNHRQPEGITFLLNQFLLISDEGQSKKARLTIFPIKKRIR
jgi:uncharacterized protein YjiK